MEVYITEIWRVVNYSKSAEMTYYVSISGTLNSTHSLTHSLTTEQELSYRKQIARQLHKH